MSAYNESHEKYYVTSSSFFHINAVNFTSEIVPTSFLCTTFAVSINYFCLTAFFRTHVYAFDLWKTFSKSCVTPWSFDKAGRRFYWHNIYAWSVPMWSISFKHFIFKIQSVWYIKWHKTFIICTCSIGIGTKDNVIYSSSFFVYMQLHVVGQTWILND